MHNSNDTYKLIQRLKRQPKQSINPLGDAFKDLSDAAGNATNVLAGLANALTGAASGVVKLLGDVAKQYTNLASQIDSDVKKGIGVGKLIELNQSLANTYAGLVKPALYFENRLSKLNKGFGITSAASQKLVKSLEQTQKNYDGSTRKLRSTNEELMQYAINIKNILPTLNQVSVADNARYQSLLDVQKIMSENVGMSEEMANSYTLYAQQSGKHATAQLRFAKTFAESVDPDGTIGAFGMITNEIATAGSEIQLQYGRLPGSLERSVMKAKKFGFALADVAAIGEKMLDVESSTGDELEYQLLTGRRLVNQQGESLTQKFREAALTGNMTKSAEALNTIIEQEGETLTKNVLARKQMAKTLGMDEKALAAALQKKKILDAMADEGITIDIDDEGALKKAAFELEKQGKLSEKDLKEFQKATDQRTTEQILDQQLSLMQEQLMATYLTNANTEETRKQILEGAVAARGTDLTSMSPDAFRDLGNVFGTIFAGKAGVSTVMDFAGDIKSGNIATGKTGKSGDVVSMPGSTHTLVGNYGELVLDPRDAVVAGPEPAIKSMMSGGNRVDMSPIVAAIKQLNKNIITLMTTDKAEGVNPDASWS